STERRQGRAPSSTWRSKSARLRSLRPKRDFSLLSVLPLQSNELPTFSRASLPAQQPAFINQRSLRTRPRPQGKPPAGLQVSRFRSAPLQKLAARSGRVNSSQGLSLAPVLVRLLQPS